MSAADAAFAAAEAEIARVRAAGETTLDLTGEDFAALTRLPDSIGTLDKLERLVLGSFVRGRSTQVTNLTPLQGLTGLQILDLDSTPVTDLTPLQGLTGLQSLTLAGTQVTDLTPLQDLTGLQSLNLRSTQVTNLTPLQGLTGLQILDLDSTPVTDLTPLQGLTGLQSLTLAGTQVTDLTPLQDLTGLQSLNLISTQVTDLTPLQGLTGLQSLDLDSTQITDLTPLQGLTGLQFLDLRSTQVTDLRPLLNLDLLWDKAGEDGPSDPVWGIWYMNTPATKADQELAELAEIEDRKDRAQKTRAYLQSLPPWPEPLPWQVTDRDASEEEQTEGTAPTLPGKRAAPLYVDIGADGRLRQVPAPPDLPQDQAQRAEQAWEGLKKYLAEFDQAYLDRLGNKMPRLSKALASLSRSLGEDYAAINEIDVGMACARVTSVAGAAGVILSDEDAAEINAFAAQTALYVRRFNGWVDYQNDPVPDEVTEERLAETRGDFAALLQQMQDLDYATAPVAAVYADLVDIPMDEAFDATAAKGLVFATSNILDATAEAGLAAATEMRANDPKRWAALKSDFRKETRSQGIKNTVRAGYATAATTGSAALDMILNNGKNLLHLAQKYPETLGFLEAVVKFFL